MMGMKLPPSSVKCIPNPCLFLKEFSWDSGIRNSFKFFILLENAHSFLFSKFSAQPKENQFEIQQITFTWKMVTVEHGSHSALPFLWQCKISQKVDSVSTMGKAVSQNQSKTVKCFPKGKIQHSLLLYFFSAWLYFLRKERQHAWQSLNYLLALLQNIYTLFKTYLN